MTHTKKRVRSQTLSNECRGSKYVCPGCNKEFSLKQLDHQKKISEDEIDDWIRIFGSSTQVLHHKPCRSCSGKLRENTQSQYIFLSASTFERLNNIRIKLDSTNSFEELVITLCDKYEEKEESIVNYKCRTCKYLNNNICGIDNVEMKEQGVQCGEVPEGLLQLSLTDGPTFKVRETQNPNGLGQLTLEMEYLSARLQHIQIPATRINLVISACLDSLGVKLIGRLPSIDQHILIAHRFVIYGDLYFTNNTSTKTFCLGVDDFSRKYIANQVLTLTYQSGDSTKSHVADISRIDKKTIESKKQEVFRTRDYYAVLNQILDNTMMDAEATDILSRISAKQSDRFIVEKLLGEELSQYIKKKGGKELILVYCAAHCANTAVELASSIRSDDNKAYHDHGYRLSRQIINEYRRNKIIRGFLYQCTGRLFSFSKESTSRFYQNMRDHKDIYLLLDSMKEAVDIQEQFEIATEKVARKEIVELKTMLSCSVHRTNLFVCVVEVTKLLRPYLELLSQKKDALSFYPAMVNIVDKMIMIKNDSMLIQEFLFDPNEQVFPDCCVKDKVPLERKVDESIAIHQTQKTLSAWIETLEKVVVDFRPTGKYGKIGNMTLETLKHVPAVSCLPESIVGSSSQSRRQAPHGSCRYHSTRVKLARNEFPPFHFINQLSKEQRQMINQTARDWKMKETENSHNVIQVTNELSSALKVIANHEEKNTRKKQQGASRDDSIVSTNAENSNVSQSSELAVTYNLASITHHDADGLKGKKLDQYLQVNKISRGGSADDKRFKLKQFLVFAQLTETQKHTIRDNVLQLVKEPRDIFMKMAQDLSFDEQHFRLDIEIPQVDVRSYFMDWEACFRSSKYAHTGLKRPGGKQFYQTAKVSIFEGLGMSSFARRNYIQPLPDSAKNKKKFVVTATDSRIVDAPLPTDVMKVWQFYDQQLNIKGKLLIWYWASTTFDINMLRDAHEETGTHNVHRIMYANALKIVRLLLPGLPSYSLEELNNQLGFPEYNAHDAMADCLAGWRCLLYAVHCHVGLSVNLNEEIFHDVMLNLLDRFDAFIVENVDDPQDCSQNEGSVSETEP